MSMVGPSNSHPPVSGPPTTPAESMGVDEHVHGGWNQVMGTLHPATPTILVVSTTLNTWTTSTTFPCVNRFIIDLSSTPIPSHLPYRLLLARVNSQYLVDIPNKLCTRSTEQTSFGVWTTRDEGQTMGWILIVNKFTICVCLSSWLSESKVKHIFPHTWITTKFHASAAFSASKRADLTPSLSPLGSTGGGWGDWERRRGEVNKSEGDGRFITRKGAGSSDIIKARQG
ncbi:hypothetical protein BS47DRAFT_1366822 [Hydnum rufescens UP504]|uniref:Uncharacterized protein n=1 Tax=Hydnum rufescens UP504 TaxID=1448309 RepID=A0A9P6AKH5_9AGAM|nr:hypothetical protein BS47DRAFT_1366822 [Hydnum rufescens UP504]